MAGPPECQSLVHGRAQGKPNSGDRAIKNLNASPRQRELLPVRGLAVEAAGGGECKLAERLTIMVADDQRALLEGPFAARKEIARAAAFRRDGAFACVGRAAEI